MAISIVFILTFIRVIVTEEGSCAPEIFYMDFYLFYLILPESRDLLGFYCGALLYLLALLLLYSLLYNIMFLTLLTAGESGIPLCNDLFLLFHNRLYSNKTQSEC